MTNEPWIDAEHPDIDLVARHYLVAAVWANCEEGTSPTVNDEALDAAKKDCAWFFLATGKGLIEETIKALADGHVAGYKGALERIGHDIWLTRCRHGAGFWDRQELYLQKDVIAPDGSAVTARLGELLTLVAHQMGEPRYFQADDVFHVESSDLAAVSPFTCLQHQQTQKENEGPSI